MIHTEKWPRIRPSARGVPKQDPEEKHVIFNLLGTIIVVHVYRNVK